MLYTYAIFSYFSSDLYCFFQQAGVRHTEQKVLYTEIFLHLFYFLAATEYKFLC